jgi:hypothetical protein
MATELDLHALRQLTPLEAARALTAMSVAELRYIGKLRGLKTTKGMDKADLVAAIIAFTHPRPAPAAPAQQYQQDGLFDPTPHPEP